MSKCLHYRKVVKAIEKLGYRFERGTCGGGHHMYVNGKKKIVISSAGVNRMLLRRLLKENGHPEYRNF